MSKRSLLIMSFLFVFTFGGFVSDLSTLNAAQESKTEQTTKKNKKNDPDRLEFNKRLTERAARSLNGYGVSVLQVQLTEFAPCRAIALNGNAVVGHHALWTGF